jgi:hypothetical protein
VSELKDVMVELDGATTAGYTLDRNDGIVRWSLKLAPGEQRAIDLAFHIDVPSDYY